MRHSPQSNDPRTAATARGSESVALGKLTAIHTSKQVQMRSTPANDCRAEAGATKVIFEHAKSGNKRLIAQVAEFRGYSFLDIREWVDAADGLTPTKKGVSVPLGAVQRLGEALLAISLSNEEMPEKA